MSDGTPEQSAPPTAGGEAAAAAAPEKEEAAAEGDDEDMSDEVISLKSKEGKEIEVLMRNAMISGVVSSALVQNPASTVVSCNTVRTEVLDLVVEYMNHHQGIEPPVVEKPIKSQVMAQNCSDEWDAKWINKNSQSKQILYDLVLAANNMDIKGLLHLTCAKIASLIKGQKTEDLKKILAVN